MTMTLALPPVVHAPLRMHFGSGKGMTDEEFFEFCRVNRDLRIERTVKGEVIVMPPTGVETGDRNAEITMQLRLWAKKNGEGRTFDSSTAFSLPNGATRAPDAAWVRHERLDGLTSQEKRRFAPLCPEFVIELRSPSDTLADVEEKMREYMDNGATLGWLVDPDTRCVHVYRAGAPVERRENPTSVSAEPVLRGFVLDLREIWETGM